MEGGIGVRGRRGKMDMIDGEIVEIRTINRMGYTSTVTLPKAWIDIVSRKGELKGVGVTFTEEAVIIRPYYGEAGK